MLSRYKLSDILLDDIRPTLLGALHPEYIIVLDADTHDMRQ